MRLAQILAPMLFVGMSLFMAGCGQQIVEPTASRRIVLSNDDAELQSHITYFEDQQLPLLQPPRNAGQIQGRRAIVSSGTIAIMLRAEVSSPVVDGYPLHASHVTFNNKHAYVAYHTRDNTYRGGVDIIDIERFKLPKLRSRALFADTDITIAVQDKGTLFLGESTDSDQNPDFSTPAGLEMVELRNQKFTDRTTRLDLPSSNGNDIARFDHATFVTTGTTDGHLLVVPNQSNSVTTRIPVPGAKAVDKSNDYVLVLAGTGARLHLFDRSTLAWIKTIELGCQNEPSAKAEMDVANDIVFVSAGRCGLLRIDLQSETVTLALSAPPGGRINSVAVSDGLVFLANGGHGLQVAEMTSTGVAVIGSARFEGSTNFVGANHDVLFVANGAGGLKICEIVR